MTTSPFKQRLLMRRGGKPASTQALIRAKVPQLSSAGAGALARVAAEDETVAALREGTRESLHAMRFLPPARQREEAAELGGKLQARADALRKEIMHARHWKRDVPGALSAASGVAAAALAIGAAGPATATPGLVGGLSAMFGIGAATAGYRADRAASRGQAAFALIVGDGLASLWQTSRPSRQKPVTPITAVMTASTAAQPFRNE